MSNAFLMDALRQAELWSGLSREIQAALIGGGATVLSAIVGFGALILQMRSQARESRASIAENERRKLKAAMYEDAVLVCRALADAAVEMSSRLRAMMLQLGIASEAYGKSRDFSVPNVRYVELIALYRAFSDAALRFIFLVENRRVIDPRILVFRTAMATVMHDTRELLSDGLSAHAMKALPLEDSDGQLFPYTPPTTEELKNIAKVVDSYLNALGDAIGYEEDFMVEMQNHLLGDLFGTLVQHRVPLNPSVVVVTLERAHELEQWFLANTPWGQTVARVEQETLAKYVETNRSG